MKKRIFINKVKSRIIWVGIGKDRVTLIKRKELKTKYVKSKLCNLVIAKLYDSIFKVLHFRLFDTAPSHLDMLCLQPIPRHVMTPCTFQICTSPQFRSKVHFKQLLKHSGFLRNVTKISIYS